MLQVRGHAGRREQLRGGCGSARAQGSRPTPARFTRTWRIALRQAFGKHRDPSHHHHRPAASSVRVRWLPINQMHSNTNTWWELHHNPDTSAMLFFSLIDKPLCPKLQILFSFFYILLHLHCWPNESREQARLTCFWVANVCSDAVLCQWWTG